LNGENRARYRADVPFEAGALFNRGVAKKGQGCEDDALADWTDIVKRPDVPGEVRILAGQAALGSAFARDDEQGLNLVVKALDEWLAHLTAEDRTARLMEFLVALAQPAAQGIWVYAFNHLVTDRGDEMGVQLEVLNPIAEVLATGDRAKLDPLSPEQRDFALEVLRRFERPESVDERSA
jgi:hypothetical protein